MNGVKTSRICIICIILGLFSGAVQAMGFSIGNKPAKSSPVISNRPWGNIGTYKPGLQDQMPPAMQNAPASGYSFSYNYTYNTNPASNTVSNNTNSRPGGYYMGGAPGTGWPMPMSQAGTAMPYPSQAGMLYMPQAGNAMPYSASGSGYQYHGQSRGDPVIEVEISKVAPLVQQNIIYTIKVVSGGNLKTLNPVLPRIEGASLKKIDGPVASVRQKPGGHEIVNEYRYRLTPLQSGEIMIPPIRFKGTHVQDAQWNGRRGPQNPSRTGGGAFDISSGESLTLNVQPADPAVKPWLPLHSLKMHASMNNGNAMKAGVPVTLSLFLEAKGATGDQLPSLEKQLKNGDFRVYLEKTEMEGKVSANGRHLLGKRTETYTMIPLKDGVVDLPFLSVAWWDVDSDVAKMAGLPGQVGYAGYGREVISRIGDISKGAATSIYFWLPLLVTLALIIGYWFGAWARTKPFLKGIGEKINASALKPARQQLVQTSHAVGRVISPASYTRKVRIGFARLMPRPVQLWFCTRCIEQEDNPTKWCQQFKTRVCCHLGISEHTPMPEIAEKLIDSHPNAEPAQVRALVQSLDGAIYGGQPIDFVSWKREFRNQLRPGLFSRRRRSRRKRVELPALNPRTA